MNDEVRERLEQVITEVVEPSAAAVDHDGTFPRMGIDALGKAGLLGLTVAPEHGGGGGTLGDAAAVVERLSSVCASTAMVVLMHYSAVALLNQAASPEELQRVASGGHLVTLALSETGTRSHFWVSQSKATRDGSDVLLNGAKSWITAAGEADSYVWSTLPADGEGAMSLWLVPSDAAGLSDPPRFEGLGLRGNASSPVTADGVRIPAANLLGTDGAGLDMSMEHVLPWFLVMSAAFSVGLMEAVVAATVGHLTSTRLEHLNATLADQPLARAQLGRMRVEVDKARALLQRTLAALESRTPDEMMLVLEIKAAAAESAVEVTDLAMTVCGGSAFRRGLGIERRFRDARAARVMAPTTDALRDFIARLMCGLPLLDAPES